jgi:hypothetical protein
MEKLHSFYDDTIVLKSTSAKSLFEMKDDR